MTDEDLRQLRGELIQLRKRMGLQQWEVADRLGVTPASVSGFETGRGVPRVITCQRYAHALGARLRLTVVARRTVS